MHIEDKDTDIDTAEQMCLHEKAVFLFSTYERTDFQEINSHDDAGDPRGND